MGQDATNDPPFPGANRNVQGRSLLRQHSKLDTNDAHDQTAQRSHQLGYDGFVSGMFRNYSTFKTYHRLTNLYATLVDTTKLPIEGIGIAVYTLNGRNILTRNALHIPALRGPLYSLRKHLQGPGCGVYLSYKHGSYLFLPEFILHVEDSYDNLVSYQSLGASYKFPIDYI